MKPEQKSRHRIIAGLRSGLCTFVSLILVSFSASAHTPHHVIDALALSPDYENDTTLFILVHNYLLRSADRAASWKQLVNGLDSPHVLSDIAVSPAFGRDGTLFVATDGSGIYSSDDRGQSWHHFNNGLSEQHIGMLLASDSQNDLLLVAAGSATGLFVSSMREADWRRALSDDVQITALRMENDGESAYVLAGDSTGGIWKSSGDLRSWIRIARLENAGAVTAFAVSKSNAGPDLLFVGTEKAGLLRASPETLIFEPLSRGWADRAADCSGQALVPPRPDTHVRDIALADNGQGIFVTTWNKAVRVSHDGGGSWSIQDTGLRCDPQADAAAFSVPHFRDLKVAGAGKSDWFLAGFDGLYRSEDQGESWVQFETMPVSLIRGFAVSPAAGSQQKIAVTTYGGGAYLSADQGQSWLIANGGLVSTRLADIGFSPDYWNDGLIFSLSKERLLASDRIEDGWSAHLLRYRGWRRKVGYNLERRLGFSAEYGSKLFLSDAERRGVWPMLLDLSPSFGTDQTMVIGFRRHGVWISNDAGASWDRSWDGPTDYVTALQMSPDFPEDETVFAGIRGGGIYVSRDGADSWEPSSAGFAYLMKNQATASPNRFIDPPLIRAATDVLLVVSPAFAQDRTVFASSAAGIFKSRDAGRTWKKLSLSPLLVDVPVVGLGISPAYEDDKTILVSFKGRGLYRSTDAGSNFELASASLLQDNFDLRTIQFSPSFQSDSVVYGATDWDLLISRDSGDTWEVISRPIRYEDWRGANPGPIRFTGGWTRETGAQYSASTQTVSDRKGARATLNFVGNTIRWTGARGPVGGQARVSVDGVDVTIVDLYAENTSANTEILKISNIENGPHDIVIEVSAEKNHKSQGYQISIDSLDVSYQ